MTVVKKYRSGVSQSEQAIQADFIEWIDLNKRRFPELTLLYAIPNSAKRGKVDGWVMKLTGTRRGVPDICLPLPSRSKQYLGLYIEFKSAKGVLSEHQEAWIAALKTAGHRVEVLRSWTDAANTMIDYLELDIPKL